MTLEGIRERLKIETPLWPKDYKADISWLLAEVDRLLEALKPFAAFHDSVIVQDERHYGRKQQDNDTWNGFSVGDYRRAAAALQGEKTDGQKIG